VQLTSTKSVWPSGGKITFRLCPDDHKGILVTMVCMEQGFLFSFLCAGLGYCVTSLCQQFQDTVLFD
jgi:hypothetical protein